MVNTRGEKIDTNIQTNTLVKFDESEFVFEEQLEGDESTPETSWRLQMRPPSTFRLEDAQSAEPDVVIKLEHCLGYRSK